MIQKKKIKLDKHCKIGERETFKSFFIKYFKESHHVSESTV